jgi:hypothetical protein
MKNNLFIICFAILCFLLPSNLAAQRRFKLFQKVDSIMDLRQQKSKLDTNYVSRPDRYWTLRLINNISGTNFTLKGVDDEGENVNFKFKDPLRHTITLGANYRGLAVSLAFNPSNLFGKKTSTEINVNAYGNRFGLDFIYENNGEFKGEVDWGGEIYDLETEIREKSLTINAYYAFNGRKFSYPAAFSQSYVQKRSAGSLMAGLSYHRTSVFIKEDEGVVHEADDIRKIKLSYVSAGLGYGYNFVPHRSWLIHLSTLPTIVFWRDNKVIKMVGVESMTSTFPEIAIVGRFSLVHYFKHFFMGLTMVYNYTSAGDYDVFRLRHNKWRSRIIIGKRF